ncbi:unnamed protein product [Brugia pahangi]|uniref:DUF1084 domain-containing protein n=1 Tax=Brugia pahangi TaxID=6280 RepID=A0A0N4TIC2_BRUPA|nr:unnamed protein product [Brugia pahangi]
MQRFDVVGRTTGCCSTQYHLSDFRDVSGLKVPHRVTVPFSPDNSSTYLSVMKIEIYSSLTYWHVFTPLFIATALNLYFLFIVLIRAIVEEKQCKDPILKHAFSWLRLVMIGIFEALLCYKVNGDLEDGQVAVQSSYGIVFLPVWVLMAALCFQAFRLL